MKLVCKCGKSKIEGFKICYSNCAGGKHSDCVLESCRSKRKFGSILCKKHEYKWTISSYFNSTFTERFDLFVESIRSNEK